METALAPLEPSTPVSVVNFYLTDEQIAETRAKYAALDASTPVGYEEVRQALSIVRGTRVGVERRRVELKAEALEYGRKVDAEARRLTTLIESIEAPLVDKKRTVDDEKARLKAEADAEKIREFNAKMDAARAEEEARLKAIRDAEEARIAEERTKLDAERAQLAEERRVADEARAAAQAIEDARLAAEREQERLAREAEDARLRTEREALERERRALDDQRQADERAEFERQATARAEKDAADRLAAEQLAAAEQEARIAAVLPDAKKLDAFATTIRALTPPTVKSKAAKEALARALHELELVAQRVTGLERRV